MDKQRIIFIVSIIVFILLIVSIIFLIQQKAVLSDCKNRLNESLNFAENYLNNCMTIDHRGEPYTLCRQKDIIK